MRVFVTSEGEFLVKFHDKEAPKTVENFVGLAEGTREWTNPATGKKHAAPFYDGLVFHRVIDGFVIQGGCPIGDGEGVQVTVSPTSSTRRGDTTGQASSRWPTLGPTPTAASSS